MAAHTVARRVKEVPDHLVATFARLGYATIGVVYLLIGTLATQAALGTGALAKIPGASSPPLRGNRSGVSSLE